MSIEFFKDIIRLKEIKRQGWIKKLGLQNPESVADHSYSVSMMAMIFSDLLKLNTEKILKMSLLHDLAESKIGDITPEEMSKDNKIKKENNAMKEILEKLDSSISDEYIAIWNEYIDSNSSESKLLHQIDKLEMALQAKCYENTSLSVQEFLDSAKSEIHDVDLFKFLQQIINHKNFKNNHV